MSKYKFKVGDKVRHPGLSTAYKVGQRPFIVEGYLYDPETNMEYVVDKNGQEHAETQLELVPDWEYELTNDSTSEFRDSLAAELGVDPEAAARAINQFRGEETTEFSLDEPYALWELELLAGPEFVKSVSETLDLVKRTLLEKNISYGNSALDPVRVFSKASPTEQLKVRIDDKISRLQRGGEDTEDTVLDLIGYLILLKIAEGK